MLIQLLRKLSRKFLRHYMWPARLHSRLFDFDHYYSKNENVQRINIGAGPYFSKGGWVAIDFLADFRNETDSTKYIDLTKCLDILPFSDVEAFYLSHTLEHFRLEDAGRLLVAMYKTMRPGGVLRIVVPSADLILDRVRADDIEYFAPYFSYFKNINKEEIKCIDMMYHLLCQPKCRFGETQINANSENITDTDNVKLLAKSNGEILELLNNHSFENNATGSLHLSAYNADLLIQMLLGAGFSNAYQSAFMQSHYGPMRETPLFDGTHPWMSLYIEAVK